MALAKMPLAPTQRAQRVHPWMQKVSAVASPSPSDFAQGYLFGKPMRDRQLLTMVMAGRAQSVDFCNSNVWDVEPSPIPGPGTT